MEKFLTEETPEKVMTLLATSLVSMFLLFAVTASGASFHQVQNPLPDPFNPANVIAVMENTANGYSGFLAANLINPASQQFEAVALNVGQATNYASGQLANLTGLQDPMEASLAAAQMPRVAGMSIRVYPPR